jgi:hypothetical protein
LVTTSSFCGLLRSAYQCSPIDLTYLPDDAYATFYQTI